jgi:hypothetical protein
MVKSIAGNLIVCKLKKTRSTLQAEGKKKGGPLTR